MQLHSTIYDNVKYSADLPFDGAATGVTAEAVPWVIPALRPLVVCSPDLAFCESITRHGREKGMKTVNCNEVPQLSTTMAEAMPDCILIEGPAEFVNHAILYCEVVENDDACVLVSASRGQLSLDLPAKITRLIHVIRQPASPPELVNLMHRAASLHALRRAAQQFLARHRRVLSKLTAGQHGVLHDVCVGKLNKRIANEQGVSLRTIEQRRRRVFDVLGVASAAPMGYEVGFATALELFVDAFDNLEIV